MSGTVRPLESIGKTNRDDAWLDASFTDDGSVLVVWSSDHGQAVRLDVASGRSTPLTLADREATPLELVALPDGTAQTWSDGAVSRYDASGRLAQVLDVHRAPVRDVLVLPDGRSAATVGDAGEIELWNITRRGGTWSLGESLVGHGGRVEEAEVLGEATLLTASVDGQLISWDLTDDAGFGSAYPGLDERWVSNRIGVIDPGELVVAPTRTTSNQSTNLYAAGGPDTLSVAATFLDPRSGQVVDEVVVGDAAPDTVFGSSVAVSPDRRLVAVTSSVKTTVLDSRTREVVAQIKMPIGRGELVWCATWSPDGSQLILGVEGYNYPGLTVVDTSTWKVLRNIGLTAGAAQVFEWTPDGTHLAVGVLYTGTIELFDESLRMVRRIDLGPGGDVFDLAFSPDGKLLAAARVGGQVSVIDTTTWKQVQAPIRVHSGSVTDVEWLPDSNTVVTAGFDEVVSMYDVRRDLVRSRPLPAASDPGDGHTYLMPGIDRELVVVNEGGHRSSLPVEPSEVAGGRLLDRGT